MGNASAADTKMQHFFALGFQRSGTTMLRLILNSHSKISVPHETFFIHQYDRLASLGSLDDRAVRARILNEIAADRFVVEGSFMTAAGRDAAMEETTFAAMTARLFEAYAAREGKTIWGDKTPSYEPRASLLAHMFPEARFVHIVRDIRAVAASTKQLSWGTRDVETLAIDWNLATLTANRIGRLLGDRYMMFRYEDLVTEPVGVVQRICAHLDVPFEAAMLEFHRDAQAHTPETAKRWHQNSMRAPDPAKIDEWRKLLSAAEISLIEGRAGNTLSRFGYDLVDPRQTQLLRLGKIGVMLRARMHRNKPARRG